jgi:hypothetical protein
MRGRSLAPSSVDVASSARRLASSNGTSRAIGQGSGAALPWGRRRAAAHRPMPAPELWPALAVSEQGMLDEPSNITLQPTSGAATGMRRIDRRTCPGASCCAIVSAHSGERPSGPARG